VTISEWSGSVRFIPSARPFDTQQMWYQVDPSSALEHMSKIKIPSLLGIDHQVVKPVSYQLRVHEARALGYVLQQKNFLSRCQHKLTDICNRKIKNSDAEPLTLNSKNPFCRNFSVYGCSASCRSWRTNLRYVTDCNFFTRLMTYH
jgi:hypothetical protein